MVEHYAEWKSGQVSQAGKSVTKKNLDLIIMDLIKIRN